MLDTLERVGTAGLPGESLPHVGANADRERLDGRRTGAGRPAASAASAFAIPERDLASLPGRVTVGAVRLRCDGHAASPLDPAETD